MKEEGKGVDNRIMVDAIGDEVKVDEMPTRKLLEVKSGKEGRER